MANIFITPSPNYPMKKRVFLLILLLAIPLIQAAADPSDASQVIGEEFGVNPDNIPTDPEEIKSQYLQQEWAKLVAENKILGPIHRFLIKISPVFSVILNHPYEISLTFFGIFVLWLLIVLGGLKFCKSFNLNGWLSGGIGIVFASILAQINLIGIVVTSILDIIFKQENWWIRLILGILIIGAIVIAIYSWLYLSSYIKKQKKAGKEKEADQKLKETKAFVKGVKE